jgi:hypothetical protein
LETIVKDNKLMQGISMPKPCNSSSNHYFHLLNIIVKLKRYMHKVKLKTNERNAIEAMFLGGSLVFLDISPNKGCHPCIIICSS